MTRWSNWAGSVRCQAAAIERPRSLEDVAASVRRAAAARQTLRVAGSGHSFTPLVATDGVLLSLEDARGTLSLDSETMQASVPGGMRLRALGEALFSHDVAMANLGDIDAQALAGALATGTHGTGLALGSLSTQVTGLTLVSGTGEVVECDSQHEPEVFQAARLSLGALGVTWQARMKVVPAYRLRYVRKGLDLEDCLARLPDLSAHRHFEFYWFPHTHRVDSKTMDVTDEAPSADGLGRWLNDVVLENGAFGLLCKACRLAPRLTAPVSRLCARLVSEGTRVGPSHRIFATPRLVRFLEMEYAVAAERGADCLREIQRYVEAKRVRVHFPVEFRYVKGDDVWLSPAFGRDSAYIAVHQYRGMAHEEYFAAVEAIFRNHGGRPHWGKLHTRTTADLIRLYPMWERFHAVRRRLDPGGLFLSRYLRALFGA